MLEHARAGTPAQIWGDGENLRDFIYIDDVVEATMRLIRLPQYSGTYNLGSTTGYSVNEVRAVVEHVSGVAVPVLHYPGRGIDVRAIVLDTGRIEARLSWKPHTGVETGVRQTW